MNWDAGKGEWIAEDVRKLGIICWVLFGLSWVVVTLADADGLWVPVVLLMFVATYVLGRDTGYREGWKDAKDDAREP